MSPEDELPLSPQSFLPPSSPLSNRTSPTPVTPRRQHDQQLSSDWSPSPLRSKEELKAINRAAGVAKRLATLARNKAEHTSMPVTGSEHTSLPELFLHKADDMTDGLTEGLHEFARQPSSKCAVLNVIHAANSVQDSDPWIHIRAVAVEVFTLLDQHNVTWGELLEYFSDPQAKQGHRRWHGFFKNRAQVERVLNHWMLPQNSGRHILHSWAIQYVSKLVDSEGNAVTNEGLLQARKKVVDESFVLGFDLQDLYERLRALCPVMTSMIQAFSVTRRQERTQEKKKSSNIDTKQRTVRVIVHTQCDVTKLETQSQGTLATLLDLLGRRSQQNSWSKYLFGLYLYATGTQRQTIAVLSTWGVCSSYTTLVGTGSSAAVTVQQANGSPPDSQTHLMLSATALGPTEYSISEANSQHSCKDYDDDAASISTVDDQEPLGHDGEHSSFEPSHAGTYEEPQVSRSSSSLSQHVYVAFAEV